MSKEYYTVAEVADEFEVTEGAVRDWINKHKLLAIQPGGEGGAYRIPAYALEVFRDRSARSRRTQSDVRVGSEIDIYEERILPVLRETGPTADDLLRRMATDCVLVSRYPSFAGDYAAFVENTARTVSRNA